MNNNLFLKRIEKESKDWNNFETEITYNETNVVILFKKINFKVICGEHYPFRAPKVLVKDKEYNIYLNELQYSNSLNKQIKKMLNIECLCCESLLCPNNWKPSKKIIDIVRQYLYFNSLFFV